jgi:Flp pilus assembly pilin Flp
MSIFERIYMTVSMLQDRRDRGDKGASMVEYALLVAGMAGVVAAAVILLGDKITTFINGISF